MPDKFYQPSLFNGAEGEGQAAAETPDWFTRAWEDTGSAADKPQPAQAAGFAPALSGHRQTGKEIRPRVDAGDTLAVLAAEAEGCRNCRLRAGCRGVVFGDGIPTARLLLVGEGPGETEDRLGRPFVGKAGQLLDKILAAAGLPRASVYIANIVKCRPPANRLPQPDEVAACLPLLEQQIAIIRPDIIVCLGALATQTLIDPDARITKVRGRVFEKAGRKLIPTFHPAALLRDESKKRPVWEDFKLIRDLYNALPDR